MHSTTTIHFEAREFGKYKQLKTIPFLPFQNVINHHCFLQSKQARQQEKSTKNHNHTIIQFVLGPSSPIVPGNLLIELDFWKNLYPLNKHLRSIGNRSYTYTSFHSDEIPSNEAHYSQLFLYDDRLAIGG